MENKYLNRLRFNLKSEDKTSQPRFEVDMDDKVFRQRLWENKFATN